MAHAAPTKRSPQNWLPGKRCERRLRRRVWPSARPPVGLYFQKAIAAAQKRHLAAIKALAEVRKLALPAVQLDIAKKQVNVAGAR